jgi:SAM-dependent methyltransferase
VSRAKTRGGATALATSNAKASMAEAVIPRPASDVLDYIERNRLAWEKWAPEYVAAGRRAWQDVELRWGLWNLPESQLRLFEGLSPGDDVVELGCGTAAISAWAARGGLRPVAIDIARHQLETAERFQREYTLSFPLIHANAEQVPFDAESFDLAVSEYGTSLWSNPRRWLPEAKRLLRPGGRLVFFTNSPLLMSCTPTDGSPVSERLVRDYFSRYRVEFDSDGAVEFHLTHGHWIRILRACGFVVENIVEVRPPPDATPRYEYVSVEWARRWPSEEIWVARKAA